MLKPPLLSVSTDSKLGGLGGGGRNPPLTPLMLDMAGLHSSPPNGGAWIVPPNSVAEA
jgi:hypothetical protein